MMVTHYLKIAFRNLWKYKSQTLISIIGLAVGFTCFALATLWIVYEMTYDNFHKNAKQMYVVYRPDAFNPTGYTGHTPGVLAAYLKETFPEVANATTLTPSWSGSAIAVDDAEYLASVIQADSSFMRMFDIKILEGSGDFLIPVNNMTTTRTIAITREKARKLFGNEHPIGKTLKIRGIEFTICAIVSEMPKRSNYPFELIRSLHVMPSPRDAWFGTNGENTIIELVPGIDVEAFEKKLYEHDTGDEKANISKMTITPITKMRYTDQSIEREVKFRHILIFALSGLLVVLCSLFNYLTLFVTRFRMRQKELALRVVCGASRSSLFVLLSVEFMLTLLFAVALGCILTKLAIKPFFALSEIQMGLPAIYGETLLYIGGVILISLLVFWLILFIIRRRSLNVSIRRSNKKPFRKISVATQLIISIGFAFCSIVILKQMYFLHHTDQLGFSFKNRGAVSISYEGQGDALVNLLKQIPEITEAFDAEWMLNLVPQRGRMSHGVAYWDDKPDDAENITLQRLHVTPEYVAYYDFQLVAGEMLTDYDPDTLVLLNESAVKAFGWHDPIGKQFQGSHTVKGVIRNVYNFAPTAQAIPTCYSKRTQNGGGVHTGGTTVLFKYREGMWKSSREKIEQSIKTEYPDLANMFILNTEEAYGNFLKSENALIKLLYFITIICVLVCVFGFVSLVSLTCEERRKEIAIRKINGATSGDILAIFAKEYFLLLIIGAVIAFSTGYLIMQKWLEQYVARTSIPAWTYLAIVFVLAWVIVFCVGWQVWRASIENPATVVKSE
jgi:ABC-type antimicrobial peptide transport system permease subunit